MKPINAKRSAIMREVPFVKLVREAALSPVTDYPRLRSPEDVAAQMKYLTVEEVEVFAVLMMDSQSRLRGISNISRGLLNSALVHPREVFRPAIAFGAAGIIIVHNHPSGDPTPSAEDRAVTRQLVEAGKLLDLPVYDHLIVAGNQFLSFVSAGLL